MADRTAYVAGTPVLGQGNARKSHVIGGQVALVAGDLALNKTTALFKAPAGFTVTDIVGKVDDLDTNGVPTLQFTIGDAGNAARFLAASTAGQAGGALGSIATAGLGYRFTADTEIVLTATAAAATAAAGNITLYVRGFFD